MTATFPDTLPAEIPALDKPTTPCCRENRSDTELWIPDTPLGQAVAKRLEREGWEPIEEKFDKYKHLIDAAKKCFGGTVYEAWAKADHTVRVRFKQKQRELCATLTAELDAAAETKSTGEEEEVPCAVPDLSPEELAQVAELASQEGGTR